MEKKGDRVSRKVPRQVQAHVDSSVAVIDIAKEHGSADAADTSSYQLTQLSYQVETHIGEAA